MSLSISTYTVAPKIDRTDVISIEKVVWGKENLHYVPEIQGLQKTQNLAFQHPEHDNKSMF